MPKIRPIFPHSPLLPPLLPVLKLPKLQRNRVFCEFQKSRVEWSSLMCPIKWSSFQQGDRNIIRFDPHDKTYQEKQFVHMSRAFFWNS